MSLQQNWKIGFNEDQVQPSASERKSPLNKNQQQKPITPKLDLEHPNQEVVLDEVGEGEMVENKLVIPDEMVHYLNQVAETSEQPFSGSEQTAQQQYNSSAAIDQNSTIQQTKRAEQTNSTNTFNTEYINPNCTNNMNVNTNMSPNPRLMSPNSNILSPNANIINLNSNIMSPNSNLLSPGSNIMNPTLNMMSPNSNILSPNTNVMSPSSNMSPNANISVMSPNTNVLSPNSNIMSPNTNIINANNIASPSCNITQNTNTINTNSILNANTNVMSPNSQMINSNTNTIVMSPNSQMIGSNTVPNVVNAQTSTIDPQNYNSAGNQNSTLDPAKVHIRNRLGYNSNNCPMANNSFPMNHYSQIQQSLCANTGNNCTNDMPASGNLCSNNTNRNPNVALNNCHDKHQENSFGYCNDIQKSSTHQMNPNLNVRPCQHIHGYYHRTDYSASNCCVMNHNCIEQQMPFKNMAQKQNFSNCYSNNEIQCNDISQSQMSPNMPNVNNFGTNNVTNNPEQNPTPVQQGHPESQVGMAANNGQNTHNMRPDTYLRTLEYVQSCQSWNYSDNELVSSTTNPLTTSNMVINDLTTSLNSLLEENRFLQMIQ